nr:JAB domain-containing protein [Pontibacter diazotrophicus]
MRLLHRPLPHPLLRHLTPSAADLQLTKKIKQGGELLDIAVLYHIIITSESYYSLAGEVLL